MERQAVRCAAETERNRASKRRTNTKGQGGRQLQIYKVRNEEERNSNILSMNHKYKHGDRQNNTRRYRHTHTYKGRYTMMRIGTKTQAERDTKRQKEI